MSNLYRMTKIERRERNRQVLQALWLALDDSFRNGGYTIETILNKAIQFGHVNAVMRDEIRFMLDVTPRQLIETSFPEKK